jgi:hypothetical protein
MIKRSKETFLEYLDLARQIRKIQELEDLYLPFWGTQAVGRSANVASEQLSLFGL